MFSQDFKELLSAFNEHRVKYLIVGGYAVAVHAQPRATKDLDLFVQPEPENAKAVYAALAKFGAPLDGLKPDDLIAPNSFFRMGNPPQMIEVLPHISGVKFDDAWQRRIEEVIDERSGLKVFVISAEDFVVNKLASARLQDLADVDAVRKAAESQRPKVKKNRADIAEGGPKQ
ncbi:hypothetical protein ACPOL_7265 (plasmid) [Acidisarcina polymorpha]|uniref:DUF6036 domain-containing protein n=2 Tax=Acidisarcina polymorpha TaxID=2211140 RepID=A0A2Z5GCV0_9BACT|nr:hypothetical protein ACPOL_7265 [Acidisarcina polymorpha]